MPISNKGLRLNIYPNFAQRYNQNPLAKKQLFIRIFGGRDLTRAEMSGTRRCLRSYNTRIVTPQGLAVSRLQTFLT